MTIMVAVFLWQITRRRKRK